MRRKIKKKNCLIVLAILLIVIFELANPFKLYSSYKIKKLNYNKASVNKILKYGLKEEILADKYNEFVDIALQSKNFNVDNYEVYRSIKYCKIHDVLLVNKLIEKGYNAEEINCILTTGTITSIEDLIKKDKYEDIANFLKYEYAHLGNIDRYIAYQKKTISNYDETIIYVESGLDNEYYTNYNIVDKFDFLMLVNKYNCLDKDFVPDDLVKVDNSYSIGESFGNKTMLDSFYSMATSIKNETGLDILIRGGYRSYQDQEKTYNEYYKLYQQKYVDNYVARPGFSEHQTGLAIDIKASSSDIFKGTKESEWLKDNAHKYGFILRYTKATENITGYRDEVWHYRYVGIETASYIYNNGTTLEEYWVKFLNK